MRPEYVRRRAAKFVAWLFVAGSVLAAYLFVQLPHQDRRKALDLYVKEADFLFEKLWFDSVMVLRGYRTPTAYCTAMLGTERWQTFAMSEDAGKQFCNELIWAEYHAYTTLTVYLASIALVITWAWYWFSNCGRLMIGGAGNGYTPVIDMITDRITQKIAANSRVSVVHPPPVVTAAGASAGDGAVGPSIVQAAK